MSNSVQRNEIIDMAAGIIPVDLLIINGKIVDVFNQTIIEAPLAIGHGKIIGWGAYSSHQVIDAAGKYIVPGLIDGHVHIESSMLSPVEFARLVVPCGTTTVVADPHEIANVSGIAGLNYFLACSTQLPLNIKIALPSCVPATAYELNGATLLAEDLAPLFTHPNVVSLGEVMDYPAVITHQPIVMQKIDLAKRHQKVVDGHSPGLKDKALTAYIAAGVQTDHECSDIVAMRDRLSMGMYILLREGSVCCDLLKLLPAITPHNARRCVMCSDDREPDDILTSGHMNKNLRLAVAAGVDPLLAITMATLNSAECFQLRYKGAIAPNYDADLILLDNLVDFIPTDVFSGGKLVAQQGKMLTTLPQIKPPPAVLQTMQVAKLTLNDFRLPLRSDRIRVIETIPDTIVTKEQEITVIRNHMGEFEARLNPGLNKLMVIERHRATGKIGRGVLSNYGVTNGAIAISVAHDSHNIVVVGDNDEDMLLAVEHIIAMEGGIAISQHRQILAKLALPIAGLMSFEPADVVAKQVHTILKKIRQELGVTHHAEPLLSLVFMTLPVIPTLKLTANGLFSTEGYRQVDINL